jgi:hypothetical protein
VVTPRDAPSCSSLCWMCHSVVCLLSCSVFDGKKEARPRIVQAHSPRSLSFVLKVLLASTSSSTSHFTPVSSVLARAHAVPIQFLLECVALLNTLSASTLALVLARFHSPALVLKYNASLIKVKGPFTCQCEFSLVMT